MKVQRQPLAGVEQLHEQGRIGTEPLDVRVAEKSLGIGLDRVTEPAAVR